MISLLDSLRDAIALCRFCSSRNLEIGLAILLSAVLVIHWAQSSSGRLPEMTAYPAGAERKQTFFGFMEPIIDMQNTKIMRDREALLEISRDLEAGKRASLLQSLKLQSLAERYRVEWYPENLVEVAYELELRIDFVPVSLVVVQAAKESGWGTSRFAREGNNLFGEWCYRKGCGMVPSQRRAGARHEVRVFDSVEDSVIAYMHNINTGRAYGALRELRAQSRRDGATANGLKLADGLIFYSQRRQAYVDEVKAMIRQYLEFCGGGSE